MLAICLTGGIWMAVALRADDHPVVASNRIRRRDREDQPEKIGLQPDSFPAIVIHLGFLSVSNRSDWTRILIASNSTWSGDWNPEWIEWDASSIMGTTLM
jgi:hypothetical protein